MELVIVDSSCKQGETPLPASPPVSNSTRPLYPARESNQTFMLNHETIRTESANKRAPFRSPISPPLKPSSWSFDSPIYSCSDGQKVDGHSAPDKRLWIEQERGEGGHWPRGEQRGGGGREEAAVCKFLGLARGRDRAGFRGEFAWATHLRPATTFANVLLIALVY